MSGFRRGREGAASSRERRDLILAIAAAWLFVAARTAVFVFYPQSSFDSDQAIVGLMAKHLVEGRAFPLFYYGQTYMLGVDAWVAAPFFLLAGPTVGALHAATTAINLATAAVLLVCLVRWCGLRPFEALAVSIFFTLAPPYTSMSLVQAGANISPFLFILLLWMLRDRPLWFGAMLAFGVLNREFTIYAVPVLLLVQVLQGRLLRIDALRHWVLVVAAFLAIWQGIETLKPHADLMGPGTRGQLVNGAAGSEVGNVIVRVDAAPAELLARTRAMATDYFPRQIGARRIDSETAPQGRDWMFWPLAVGLLAALARGAQLTWRARRSSTPTRMPVFGWYLLGVGVLAAAGYILTRPLSTGLVDRYMLLTLYAPIGVAAILLGLEPRGWVRLGAIALLVAWAAASAVDHERVFARYLAGEEPDLAQELADGLVAHHVRVARAGYWRAYKITFLARERVKIASSDANRIDEYERLARQAGDRLVVLEPEPCGDERPSVVGWYLCPPRD